METREARVFKNGGEIVFAALHLADTIAKHYCSVISSTSPLLVVGVQKSGNRFVSLLTHYLTMHSLQFELDFITVQDSGSGEPTVKDDIELSPRGKHILIVDMLARSGRTIRFIKSRMSICSTEHSKPASVLTCALIVKSNARGIDFRGFEKVDPEIRLIGGGLDDGEGLGRGGEDVVVMT